MLPLSLFLTKGKGTLGLAEPTTGLHGCGGTSPRVPSLVRLGAWLGLGLG